MNLTVRNSKQVDYRLNKLHSWWRWCCGVLYMLCHLLYFKLRKLVNFLSQLKKTQTSSAASVQAKCWGYWLFSYAHVKLVGTFQLLQHLLPPMPNHCLWIAIRDCSFESPPGNSCQHLFKLCIASRCFHKTGRLCWVTVLCHQEQAHHHNLVCPEHPLTNSCC